MLRRALFLVALLWASCAWAQEPPLTPKSICYTATPTTGAFYQDTPVTGYAAPVGMQVLKVSRGNCAVGNVSFLQGDTSTGQHTLVWAATGSTTALHAYVQTIDYLPFIGVNNITSRVNDTNGGADTTVNLLNCTVTSTIVFGTWTTPTGTATRLNNGWCRVAGGGTVVTGLTALTTQIFMLIGGANSYAGPGGWGVMSHGVAIN